MKITQLDIHRVKNSVPERLRFPSYHAGSTVPTEVEGLPAGTLQYELVSFPGSGVLFLLVPASCVWDTQTRSPLRKFQWCPRDGGFLASLVRTPAGISCLPVQVCSPSVNFASVPVIAMPLQQGLNLSLAGEWPSPNLLLLWVFCLNLRQAAPFICYFCIL